MNTDASEYLGPLPKDDDLFKIADDIANGAAWIREWAPKVLRATTRTPKPSDQPRAEDAGRRTVGDVNRPTEASAIAHVDAEIDWKNRQRNLRYLIGLIHSNMGALKDEIAAMRDDVYGKPVKHIGPDVCCEPWCNDEAAPGRDGRCEPCQRTRTRWSERTGRPRNECPPISEKAITHRIAKRSNAPVHTDVVIDVAHIQDEIEANG